MGTDGRKGITNLTIASRNFAKALEMKDDTFKVWADQRGYTAVLHFAQSAVNLLTHTVT
jgi:hypothetical protein